MKLIEGSSSVYACSKTDLTKLVREVTPMSLLDAKNSVDRYLFIQSLSAIERDAVFSFARRIESGEYTTFQIARAFRLHQGNVPPAPIIPV